MFHIPSDSYILRYENYITNNNPHYSGFPKILLSKIESTAQDN